MAKPRMRSNGSVMANPRMRSNGSVMDNPACAVTRWRLRRSTHIGGIATDHGVTARAARSTLRAPDSPSGRRRQRSGARGISKYEVKSPRSRLLRRDTNRNEGGQRLGQRHPSQRAATPPIPPRMKIAHALAASQLRLHAALVTSNAGRGAKSQNRRGRHLTPLLRSAAEALQ